MRVLYCSLITMVLLIILPFTGKFYFILFCAIEIFVSSALLSSQIIQYHFEAIEILLGISQYSILHTKIYFLKGANYEA